MDNLIRLLFRAIKPMSFAGEPIEGGADGPPAADPPIDTSGANPPAPEAPTAVIEPDKPLVFNWKDKLSADLKDAPAMQKFDDTQAGLVKAVESHMQLEKLLGNEKVPIPKGPDDIEGWNRFSKAMGVPDKAEMYGLPDADIPEDLKGLTIEKQKFAEVAHAHKLTPAQTKGMWETYTSMVKDQFRGHLQGQEEQMKEVVNRMRSEWGDAYDSNVELGQMVINKFASDQDMQDFVTATLSKNPMGIKFLSKIGGEFAENKIGDFGYQRFSLTPEQAESEHQAIVADPNHPYNNDKATSEERQRAIDFVNGLIKTKLKAQGQA